MGSKAHTFLKQALEGRNTGIMGFAPQVPKQGNSVIP
jgi:hypothetical protein